MLRSHLIICAILLLLCIPIYLLDHYLLKSSGSNWISLDFSGLLIKGYVLLIAIHITISTLAIFYYHHFSLFKPHIFSAILSLALIGIGFFYITSLIIIIHEKNILRKKNNGKSISMISG